LFLYYSPPTFSGQTLEQNATAVGFINIKQCEEGEYLTLSVRYNFHTSSGSVQHCDIRVFSFFDAYFNNKQQMILVMKVT